MAVGEKPSAKQGWRDGGAGTVLNAVAMEDFRLASTRSMYRFLQSHSEWRQETLEEARACLGKRGRWLGPGDSMEERGVGLELGARVGEQGWLPGLGVCHGPRGPFSQLESGAGEGGWRRRWGGSGQVGGGLGRWWGIRHWPQ